MSNLDFEWDLKKNKLNLKNHKILFEEVETVFSDEKTAFSSDPDHSIKMDILLLASVLLPVLF